MDSQQLRAMAADVQEEFSSNVWEMCYILHQAYSCSLLIALPVPAQVISRSPCIAGLD